MKNYQLIKDYKHNDKYRLSFNKLAQDTFEIDFEKWYADGHWNENYICYSYLFEDEVVSNVSLNTMELIIGGQVQRAIQIGTVMTEPSHRRKGLAYELMNKIFDDYDQSYQLYFLAADEEAVSLYEKCGFKYKAENQYSIDLNGYNLLDKPLEPIKISPKKMLEIKKQAQPLSKVLCATGDEHVLMFYYTLGFSNFIYEVSDQIYVIFEIEDDILQLYDILSSRKIDLQKLIEDITPKNVNTVICHFTPEESIKNLKVSIDSTSNWMVRATSTKTLPTEARFPRISQT